MYEDILSESKLESLASSFESLEKYTRFDHRRVEFKSEPGELALIVLLVVLIPIDFVCDWREAFDAHLDCLLDIANSVDMNCIVLGIVLSNLV